MRTWLGAGELPGAFKLGREWRIPPEAVRAMLARHLAAHRARAKAPEPTTGPADLGAWRKAKGVA